MSETNYKEMTLEQLLEKLDRDIADMASLRQEIQRRRDANMQQRLEAMRDPGHFKAD